MGAWTVGVSFATASPTCGKSVPNVPAAVIERMGEPGGAPAPPFDPEGWTQ